MIKHLFLMSFFIMPANAVADIPPPAHQKRVSYGIEITNISDFKGYKLFVYPWSSSHGRPMALIGEFSEAGRLYFGRRIMGAPKLYAIKVEDFRAYQQRQESPDAVEGVMLKDFPHLDCQLEITPLHTVEVSYPHDEVVDSFLVKEISASRCSVERVLTTQKSPSGHP